VSPSGSAAWALKVTVQGGAQAAPPTTETVGGAFVPVTVASAEVVAPLSSVTVTLHVWVLRSSTAHVAEGAVPEAHPVQAYVRGLPTGLDAVAVQVAVHGVVGEGWQDVALAATLTTGAALVTVTAASAEAIPPLPSLTVTVAVAGPAAVRVQVADAPPPDAQPDHS
jgi:hypothetical protein